MNIITENRFGEYEHSDNTPFDPWEESAPSPEPIRTESYDVQGPLRSDKTIRVKAANGLDACQQAWPQYSYEQPRGPHGVIVAYVSCQRGQARRKVGPMDVSWVPPASI